jgi:hypothetical protein
LRSPDGLDEGENRKKALRTEHQICYDDDGVGVTPLPPCDVTITPRVQRTNKKRKELLNLLVISIINFFLMYILISLICLIYKCDLLQDLF